MIKGCTLITSAPVPIKKNKKSGEELSNKREINITKGIRKILRLLFFLEEAVRYCFFSQCGHVIPAANVKDFFMVSPHVHSSWQLLHTGIFHPPLSFTCTLFVVFCSTSQHKIKQKRQSVFDTYACSFLREFFLACLNQYLQQLVFCLIYSFLSVNYKNLL